MTIVNFEIIGNKMTSKIDGFGKEELKLIYNEIKRVIGVKAFRLKKKPTRINEVDQNKGQNFGFWFRAGVRGEKEAEQANQLLTQKLYILPVHMFQPSSSLRAGCYGTSSINYCDLYSF